MRFVDIGLFASFAAGRIGLLTNSPPQFGQILSSFSLAQFKQNVHSKLHILASVDSLGKSTLQHSQFGRTSSIFWFPTCLFRRGVRLSQIIGMDSVFGLLVHEGYQSQDAPEALTACCLLWQGTGGLLCVA